MRGMNKLAARYEVYECHHCQDKRKKIEWEYKLDRLAREVVMDSMNG